MSVNNLEGVVCEESVFDAIPIRVVFLSQCVVLRERVREPLHSTRNEVTHFLLVSRSLSAALLHLCIQLLGYGEARLQFGAICRKRTRSFLKLCL